MALIDEEVLKRARLERMIFHIVGPKDEDLVLLDEVIVTGFERFFLDRVRETNKGNRFAFIGLDTGVRPVLSAMARNNGAFIQKSKELAQGFQQAHQSVSSSRGALIVAALSGLEQEAFAIIKFDDLKVLRFVQEITESGGQRARVSEISNTFNEDKKAMQKSAFILLDEDGGQLAVYDRSDRANVTGYFKAFLGAKALWTPEAATKRLEKALNQAFAAKRSLAPEDVKRSWRHRLYAEAQARRTIEPGDSFETFGASVFGSFWNNPIFRSEVNDQLHRQKISDEVVTVEPTVIPKPTIRRVKTTEGITISYPRELDESERTVVIAKKSDGSAIITIHTNGIVDDDFVAASADRDHSQSR